MVLLTHHKLSGEEPPLLFYLDINQDLKDQVRQILDYFTINYNQAQQYVNRFESVREFFAEDEIVTEAQIKEERDVERFRYMCSRYHKEVEIIKNMIEIQPFGLLYLQLKNFKLTAIPEPQRLIGILGNVLPWIGKTEIDRLIEESEEMEKKLNDQPSTTIDYVKYLEYIEAANNKVNDMENVLDYCKELYDIMEEYEIPIPTDDMSNYLGVSVTMASLRNLVDKKIDDITKILKGFNDQINKYISSLISQQSWLYYINLNINEVTEFLNDLHDRLVGYQQRASEFKNYQKQFRLEVTRFDMLDEVMNDVKLRMLLSESVIGWNQMIEEWNQCNFNRLNVEKTNLFTAKNVKNINLLEKGLPKNLIVSKLKNDVELTKNKLLVVAY